MSFSSPVAISPDTTYVVGYFDPSGHYSDSPYYFYNPPPTGGHIVSSPPLKAVSASAEPVKGAFVSANGVGAYSSTSTFPTSSYEGDNYWVDPVFTPVATTAPGQVTNVSATAGASSANVSWNAPTSGGAPTKYTITPYIGSEAQSATTITGTPPATSTTITGLTAGTAYTFTVTASNSAGSGEASEHSNTITPTTKAPEPDTIFGSSTPTQVDSGDPNSAELGVKFTSEVPGNVTGIRFYKATTNTGTHIGSLWSASGTLLASATFSGESASGWQQVNFSTPVAITANTTYIAAYFDPKGHYSDTTGGFATTGVTNPPLAALANSLSPNGVGVYTTTSTFPNSSYEATNYWVDVDFEPTGTITAPGKVPNVSATAGAESANVSWNAPTSGGAPTKYTITPYIGSEARPATTITGAPPATSATITGLTAGTAYTFTVTASNSAGSGEVSEHSNTVTPTAAAAAPDTIFGSTTPTTVDSGDPNSAELGVKFTSEVPGNVTGIRFYKATTNTGTHIGSLWSASGTLLASATFSGESASGWQQVNFSTPVAITANTTYIAAYFDPKGHYSDTTGGFATTGVTNPPLAALANSLSPNGVGVYTTTSTFPNSSYEATNYWVDVDFEPTGTITAPGKVPNVSATAGAESANVSWNAPTSGGAPTKYTITPYIGSEARPATTITGAPPATSATITGLTAGTAYTFTVTASNSAGSGEASEHSNTITPTTKAPEPDTIFGSSTPTQVDSGDPNSAELGVKFTSEVPGNVTGIRFYKATTNTGTHIGSLWSASGTLLASATFSGESASGWQQVNFSTPVAITANTTYIAAYFDPKGHYSDTTRGFATAGVSNPPLAALANSASPNGVGVYTTTSTFPNSSYEATNYWVDVDFEPNP